MITEENMRKTCQEIAEIEYLLLLFLYEFRNDFLFPLAKYSVQEYLSKV